MNGNSNNQNGNNQNNNNNNRNNGRPNSHHKPYYRQNRPNNNGGDRKDFRDNRDSRDNRDNRNQNVNNRDTRDNRDNRDQRDNRDNRDNRNFNRSQNPNNNFRNNNGGGNYNNNNRNGDRNRHHQYSKNEFIQMLHKKYDTLQEQHRIARKKFFESYYRVDDYKVKKLEQQFFNAIENLRRFEKSLKPWQYEILRKKIPRYKVDNAYSENHPVTETEANPAVTVIEDPHISSNQKSRPSFKNDTEESVGTMEDYLKTRAS